MVNKNIGFDSEKYIKLQSEEISKRLKMFDNKLYLEVGGKLLDELNFARSVPGYNPEAKIEVLKKLKDKTEIIFCISADSIEKKKMRADHGISYDAELLRLINRAREFGLNTTAVVITLFSGQPEAIKFKNQLKRRKIKVYCHTYTKGYPTDIDTIVSHEGYGAQEFIETNKPIVVVAAPGPNSGKLATCLAQLYHEHRRGRKAGYAKFETMPIWDLSLKHPLNMEYEAATADLGDRNMIDNFHLEKYRKTATTYNRDLLVFPILKNILHRIIGEDIYNSPTDMGVNMIGRCIIYDEAIKVAAQSEIIRRYLDSLCGYKNGHFDIDVPNRIKLLMDELRISVEDRKVVEVALKTKFTKKSEIVAIELKNGETITGKDIKIMTASASAIMNTIKQISRIDDKIHLISPTHLNSILKLKKDIYGEGKLNLHDVLIALAVGESINPTIKLAMSSLGKLRGLEAHSTVMLSKSELDSLKKLGLNVTCTDEFAY